MTVCLISQTNKKYSFFIDWTRNITVYFMLLITHKSVPFILNGKAIEPLLASSEKILITLYKQDHALNKKDRHTSKPYASYTSEKLLS